MCVFDLFCACFLCVSSSVFSGFFYPNNLSLFCLNIYICIYIYIYIYNWSVFLSKLLPIFNLFQNLFLFSCCSFCFLSQSIVFVFLMFDNFVLFCLSFFSFKICHFFLQLLPQFFFTFFLILLFILSYF